MELKRVFKSLFRGFIVSFLVYAILTLIVAAITGRNIFDLVFSDWTIAYMICLGIWIWAIFSYEKYLESLDH